MSSQSFLSCCLALLLAVAGASAQAKAPALPGIRSTSTAEVLIVPRVSGEYAELGTVATIDQMGRLPGGKTAARYPAGVYVWRGQVQAAVAALDAEPFDGPVELHVGFELDRPKGHYGTGRNAGTVKASAPVHPSVAPDLDKLVRCVNDAITDAGLWRDDAQVVVIAAAKRYIDIGPPGVHITVKELV